MSGIPRPSSIMWEFMNKTSHTRLITIDGIKYRGATVDSPSLTISDISTSDQGIYVSKATNSVGIGTSDPIYLYATGGTYTVDCFVFV